jgi:hypothetical protein
MKKLLPALCLGIVLLTGCTTTHYVVGEPPPTVYVEPTPPVIVYGPYYGPYWNGYYWHPQHRYYYRPGPHHR